ncbi:MarR family winged helix-turn-helix transcriptional regulator [Caulobacter sp. NIBR2454]|uniref:MarR family winged helix-turn-helix transcriptional regulator n=1 Tax=Caulobacter sp. NIBR2454 TaxID=3015996 RepID=UPI0022B65B09|nr:MarR family transcriptional regulator [Caulobacter sp. NIBR2454]
MDYIAQKGASAFGSRLRRLIDRLDREVQDIYRSADVGFEPRWFSAFIAIRDAGSLTVGEIAERTGVTHAAVSQVRSAMEAAGLVQSESDPSDGRVKRLSLTPKGVAEAERLEPLWAAIAAATDQFLGEGAPQMLAQLDGLDTALSRQGLKDRVIEQMKAKGK